MQVLALIRKSNNCKKMNMLVMLGRKRTRFTEIFHWKMLAPFKRSERFGDSQENINMEKRKNIWTMKYNEIKK